MRFRERLLSPEFWFSLCLLSMVTGVLLGLLGHWSLGRWFFVPIVVAVAIICFVFIPILIYNNRKFKGKQS